MTTRPNRFRRSLCAASVAGVALALTATGPAPAAIPAAAQTWTNLMFRSLAPGAQAAQLRVSLATQQAAFVARVGDVSTAKTANLAAQTRLTAAVTADTNARARYTAATLALTNAKKALTQATKKRPRSALAVTKARNAVTATTKTRDARKLSAQQTATALKTAQTGAQTATTGLNTAIAAWKSASVAVQTTQQKITALGTAPSLAAQAAAISRDVVTQVRAGFTIKDTTLVYGVTVHKSVAYAFQRMIDDAKANGIALSGGGFRTTQRQIELRTINGCPDVWTAPASSCRVPTAIPGRSLHEIGLAVDVTSGGRTITSKSPAFIWLSAHADEYGFVNLPSEAWHWSITGG